MSRVWIKDWLQSRYKKADATAKSMRISPRPSRNCERFYAILATGGTVSNYFAICTLASAFIYLEAMFISVFVRFRDGLLFFQTHKSLSLDLR